MIEMLEKIKFSHSLRMEQRVLSLSVNEGVGGIDFPLERHLWVFPRYYCWFQLIRLAALQRVVDCPQKHNKTANLVYSVADCPLGVLVWMLFVDTNLSPSLY